jgi:hypothetical protein
MDPILAFAKNPGALIGGKQEARWIPCGQRIAGCKPRLAVKGERKCRREVTIQRIFPD